MLNGAAINLEVVRSRASAQGDAPAAGLTRFADVAADQLAAVITMTEALLALARPVRSPVEIGRLVGHLDALIAPAARSDGRRLELEGSWDALGTTSASGPVVATVLADGLLSAVDVSAHVVCRGERGAMGAVVSIECRDGHPPAMDEAIVRAAGAAGIQVEVEQAGINITFPP